jgi:multidrug resistance efflux pump
MTRKRIAIYVLVGLVPILVGAGLAAFDIWRQGSFFVTVKDAQVSVPMLGVPAPSAGRVAQLMAEVGASVEPGDVVAVLESSGGSAGTTGATGAAVPGRMRVNVRSPVAGTVLYHAVQLGASVTAGQSLLTLGDLSNVWVVANVEESRIGQVHPGQPAGVRIGALDLTLDGEVMDVAPATAGLLSSVSGAAARTSSAAARPNVAVPVRIALAWPPANAEDGRWPQLYPGMSAEVRISVR